MTTAAARAFVERAIGRPLRQSEQVVDVLALDQELEQAKDELEAAIRAEMLRVTKRWVRAGVMPRLEVTAAIRSPLEDLHELGRREALLELERLGLELPARALAAPDPVPGADFDALFETIRDGLAGIRVRMADDLVAADLEDLAGGALARALLRVPGARDLASRVISTALFSGMALTFEENEDLVGGWEYSAAMDARMCEACAPFDGRRYTTLEELFVDLPNFGPNPVCYGGGRCRCRAIPLGPGEFTAARATPPRPPASALVPRPPAGTSPAATGIRDALAAVDLVHRVPLNAPTATVRVGSLGHAAGGYHPGLRHVIVNPDAPDPAITLLHELGHHIDAHLLGTTGTYASSTARELAGWRDAVIGTRAAERILEMMLAGELHPSQGMYLLEGAELFARSYSQWVALRSGDASLRAELALLQRLPYPEQWSDADFAPVAAAFDELMEALGWTI